MGYYYSTDSALYIPKGFYFTQGSSSYTYWVPFIIKGIDYTLIKNTAYLREIGSTTNIIRLGSVKLDNGSYGTQVQLKPNNLYLYRMADGTSDIYTVCNLTDLNTALTSKQTAPSTAGTAGQVLGLDTNLEPVWTTPSASAPPEVYVGSDTPSGYTLYIEPGTRGVASGNEVEY